MTSDRTRELPSRFRSTALLTDEGARAQRGRLRSRRENVGNPSRTWNKARRGAVPANGRAEREPRAELARERGVNVRTRSCAKCALSHRAHSLLLRSSMRPDLVIVHSPVGGGHKAAAAALAEAAFDRGLSTVVLDTFEHAPRVFGKAYLAAHLAWQGALPELYGKAYFGANHRDGAFEPVRRGFDHIAWAGLVRSVVNLAPRGVVATHHL